MPVMKVFLDGLINSHFIKDVRIFLSFVLRIMAEFIRNRGIKVYVVAPIDTPSIPHSHSHAAEQVKSESCLPSSLTTPLTFH